MFMITCGNLKIRYKSGDNIQTYLHSNNLFFNYVVFYFTMHISKYKFINFHRIELFNTILIIGFFFILHLLLLNHNTLLVLAITHANLLEVHWFGELLAMGICNLQWPRCYVGVHVGYVVDGPVLVLLRFIFELAWVAIVPVIRTDFVKV